MSTVHPIVWEDAYSAVLPLINAEGLLVSSFDASAPVQDSTWVKRAKNILERTGANDVSSAGEASADFAKSDRPAPRRAQRAASSASSYSGVERRQFDPAYRYQGVERRREAQVL